MDPSISPVATTNGLGHPLRVMTYSHDSCGLGHLRRSLTLAGAIVAREPGAQALCITGTPVPNLFALPERCELLKLPSITKNAAGEYVSRSLPLSLAEITQLRSELMLAAARAFRPELVLIDHTPGGPGGELEPVLRHFRQESPETRIVIGLREVLDSPQRARAELRSTGAFDLIRSSYDEVLVYGQPEVMDYAREYQLPADIAARLCYVGAVVPDNGATATTRARTTHPPSQDRSLRLLVTAGGGEDGHELLRCAIAALRGPLATRHVQATLIAGPLMDNDSYDGLQHAIEGAPGLSLLRWSRAMDKLMADTDLVVSMGGYNTVYETLARGLPLLILPRRGPRKEQLERGRRLQALGALSLLDQDTIRDPAALAAAIEEAAAGRRQASTLSFRGASAAAEICLRNRRAYRATSN